VPEANVIKTHTKCAKQSQFNRDRTFTVPSDQNVSAHKQIRDFTLDITIIGEVVVYYMTQVAEAIHKSKVFITKAKLRKGICNHVTFGNWLKYHANSLFNITLHVNNTSTAIQKINQVLKGLPAWS
jgi:hypothetical protein